MTLQAVRAGLYTTLTACGPYLGSEVSSCDFGGLESTGAGSCLTFFPDGVSQIDPISMGTTLNSRHYQRAWRIGGTVWLRDSGQATKVLNGIWQAYDDLYNTISKDDSLNGSCQEAHLAQVSNNIDLFRKLGGQLWKPVDFAVVAMEF